MDERPVQIQGEGATLDGDLVLPEGARGIVVFAHGSGSSRHSPRNRFVAGELQASGLGTLLLDLLTEAEEQIDIFTREHRFDIDLLAQRVTAAVDWVSRELGLHARGGRPDQKRTALPLKIGLFGASTGAAAALISAAQRPNLVRAVVSRGGRPDLAGGMLSHVTAPTLLIVGALDDVVIELNRRALELLGCEKRLEIVPGATHLFEEPGTLEQVARLARAWFLRHLRTHSSRQT